MIYNQQSIVIARLIAIAWFALLWLDLMQQQHHIMLALRMEKFKEQRETG